jgi:uncharacterized membrane protein
MKRIVVYALIVALLAFIFQWMFIKYVPDLVYKIAIHRTNGQSNQWINAGKTDAKMRRVVMPNPDFVYSALFYDVTDNDLSVSGVLPDSGYASVAFYDDRCQPYYVYNNLDPMRTGKFNFRLSKAAARSSNDIQVKSARGVLICRYLMKGDSSYQKMKDYQSQLSCEVK